MAAWASLSGYLFIKPGGGGLSRLKSRRKQWCVLDESRGQLLYHKCEEDARCKPPLGHIELRGAAISLDLDNQNQFVIIVDSKEVYLTAENHESMMIWLMALQSKRDLFAKYLSKDISTTTTSTSTATTTATTTTTAVVPGLVEEQRERVRRVRTKVARPSLPHIFFSSQTSGLIPRETLLSGQHTIPTTSSQPPPLSTLPQQPPPPPPSSTDPYFSRPRHKSTSSSDVSVCREGGHKTLTASKSLQYQHYSNVINNNNNSTSQSPDGGSLSSQIRRQHLARLGESFDVGSTVKKSHGDSFQTFSKQLSASVEGTELLQRNSHSHPHPHLARPRPHSLFSNSSHGNNLNFSAPSPTLPSLLAAETSSSTSTADSDDVIQDESLRHRESGDVIGRGAGSCGGNSPTRADQQADDSSSMSASTDSILERGNNSELATRVQELEQDLISSKCQLAKAMNRQTCFQDILKQKDEIIMDLDEKLGKLGGADMAYDSKRRTTQASKELQERIRVLQNQNRFLNEEVRRLARLRSQELSKISDQDDRCSSLEGDIELWKLQYVSLIQSSIRFTNTDTMDDAELSLYGGDRHKNKVRALLDEARKVNPSLPTFENLSAGEVHVDFYGFKHQFQDCGLLLHYLCMELTQHYLSQAAPYEAHQLRWHRYMNDNAKHMLKNRKELKSLCRGGIPDQYRRSVWRSLIHDQVGDIMADKGPHYFRSLCSMLPDSPLAARYRKQIGLDLMRTMPSNIKFSTSGSKGIMDLQDVLLAFCVHNPNIGYCQGMNFLVAMALLFMDAQDAFWTLVAVTERYHTASYFDQNLLGAQADQSVLRDLLGDLLPNLAKHLLAIDIEIATVTLNWFLAIFFDAVPFQTLLRVWDCFLLEGPKVLFRFSLAILKLHEREIIHKTETISVMRHLKACARVTYDVDGLVQLAFKGFKPFPRRQDIDSKQTVYLKALKEKYRWRELQKLAFAERENLFLSLESETGSNNHTFECCVVTSTGDVWVCYGGQSQCKVCVVNCSDSTMTDLPIQFTSRVMAVCTVSDAVLFGTLSWTVYCYTTPDRTLAWEQQLNDAVLSLCEYEDEATTRVFAGLADGTVAVLEDVSSKTTFYDLMYIAIGQSPVTCLRLVDSQLWCACGNTVSIIHASTLDALDSFTVSSNPYDHILSLQPGLPGVWVSVRGSSILELWDPATLCCKMLYDTRAGRYPCLRKDDETYFNRARITCILALDYSVWVGTGEGNLITYDVFTHQGSKTPSDSSSFVGSYNDSFSATMGKEESTSLPCNEGFDPVREAAMRVRQLYLCQQEPEEEPVVMSSLTISTSSTLVNNSRESVSREYTAPDPNTTLTESRACNPDTVTTCPESVNTSSNTANNRVVENKQQSGLTLSQTDDVGASVSLDVSLLSVESISHAEDNEGITPTTSFCCVADTSVTQTDNVVSGGSTPGEALTNGDNIVTSTPQKARPENDSDKAGLMTADEERNIMQEKSTAETENENGDNPSSVGDQSTEICNSEKVTSPEEQNLDDVRLKASSPKNGMHMFYIGESGDKKVKQVWANGSVPHDTLIQPENKGENHVCDISDKKTTAKAEDGTDNAPDPALNGVTSTQAEDTTSIDSAKPGQETECHEQPTSESGVDMGSSDGSVIMQVWSALTRSRKSRQSSHDSQSTSQTSPAEGDIEGSGKKSSLEASKASSLTSSSSIDSKQSDDVFQDAHEDMGMKAEECVSSSETTGMDGSMYDTGREDMSHNTSYKSLTDTAGDARSSTHSGSGTGSEDGRRTERKKRPQSLFMNRGSKSQKSSAGCVDKHDPSSRGSKFAVGSSPNNSHSGSKSTSVSSLTTQASLDSLDNLQPADREAQYRLDYTNLHVDTDIESVCTDTSLDSRRCSSVFSDVKSDTNGKGRQSGWEDGESSDEEDGGLGMLDCDPSSFIFPQDIYNLQDGNGTVGRAMMDGGLSHLLNTPALSTFSGRTWSSYDEVSTPSVASFVESRAGRHQRGSATNGTGNHIPRNNSLLSATSVASTTELLYAADMTLMSKNKISDKPVKCLLLITQESKPLVLSFSGCHTDDEAVLKWSREKDEMLWTNDPILEYNPATKTTKLPSYMAARLSSSSSSHSLKPRSSQSSQ